MDNMIKQRFQHGCGTEIQLVLGDITREAVDAVVNAANGKLQHGGGVAAAIVRFGGDEIQAESNRLAPVPVGGATVTTGGRLPAKAVIHAVGPRWGEGEEEEKLASAVGSVLRLAEENQFKSVSMPAISTGIFGYPVKEAARVMLCEIRRTLDAGTAPCLESVRICLFDEKTLSVFEEVWRGTWCPE